jgi:2-keto-4-pentenoate hydratase/2-oxohepta-3-ene-1,7-dioic acid hydratase in catechol pathway
MKLVSYRCGSRVEVGALDAESGVIRPLADRNGGVADSLTEVIIRAVTHGDGPRVATDAEVRNLSDVRLLAPLRDPARNVMCVGKNYHDHSAEFARSGFDATSSDQGAPSHPIFFTKPASAIIGPGDEIDPHSGVTEALDYEAEVAVIIGRGGRGISVADAWDHVWGYALLNDVTARDLQHRHSQWFLGKSLDSFCPIGPWLVTADEVDGHHIDIECRVNGEVRQRASTANLIFDIPTLISTLSSGMALQPGDIVATGTPAGVGIGFDPPRFLSPGDKVVVLSPQLGSLENVVADAAVDGRRLTAAVRA